jgi:hypothetical protein
MSAADKPAPGQANDNPWYCLATLHGEQPAGMDLDEALAESNRLAWNRWVASALTEQQRAVFLKAGFPESQLVPLSSEETRAFRSAFALRSGREDGPPDANGYVDFSQTQFGRAAVFEGFLFTEAANFASATFSGGASFASATFARHANFASAIFSGNARFASTTFSSDANFALATFSHSAHFESATFSSNGYFGSATFSRSACFASATFAGFAGFESAKFSSSAHFSDTNFELATFSGDANFESATFFGDANFASATFSRDANFELATFSGNADFGSAEISSDIRFINTHFAAITIFAEAKFGSAVPDFRGARMHEATEWHGVCWPSAPQEKKAAQAAVYAYERLKQEMERLKKHDDEQFFFRKELRARRGLTSPWSGSWLLNHIYEVSSDYGQSIARPMLWLLCVFAAGFSIFALAPVFNGTRMTAAHAALVSFANIFSFLPMSRETIAGLSGAARIIGATQSLLAVLLLFLLGLALRSRFRMR